MTTQTQPDIFLAIVDNHVGITEYTADALERGSERLKVVFLARDGKDLQEKMAACERQPTLVIMDVRMPNGTGFGATKWLAENHPAIRVLVHTMVNNRKTAKDFLYAGARGFINKSCTAEELLEAIYQVADSGYHVNGFITLAMVKDAQKGWIAPGPETITPRQLEILKLLAFGYADKEIAVSLFIEVSTVRDHIIKMRDKFGCRDRKELIAEGYECGILHRLD